MINTLDKVIRANKVIDKLNNSRILITGATGTIGAALVEFLCRYNDCFDGSVSMVCPVRNMSRVPIGFDKRRDVKWLEYNPNREVDFDFSVDYAIHCAGPTRSKFMVENPVDTIDAIFGGTKRLLDYFKNNGNKRFLYLSSVEVYGDNNDDNKIFYEDTMGCVDQLALRSSYPESKRLAENLCIAYAGQYGLQTSIARLSQILGVGNGDNRLIAYFCECARNKTQIVLKSDGKATKAYCSIADCVSALLYVLAEGENTAYNVSNSSMVYSVLELAEYVSKRYIGKEVVIENKNDRVFPKSSRLILDSTKLQRLGWEPQIGIDEAFDMLLQQ